MKRLKEPSTWAGIAGILAPLAGFVPGALGLALGGIGAACGAVAVYLREQGKIA